MLRWILTPFLAKAKKPKARAKRRVAAVRVRRSSVSNNARVMRNILRMA